MDSKWLSLATTGQIRQAPDFPHTVTVLSRIQETRDIFTLRVKFNEIANCRDFAFLPGQFNMLNMYGVGEVPISIVSDPEDEYGLEHTIRSTGRVTDALARLQPGDQLGLRGPFGRGWPLTRCQGNDVIILTGGLGCAPTLSAINYILQRRHLFGHLTIIQGVRHADDMIWQQRYDQWAWLPDTTVLLASDQAEKHWGNFVGHVTDLLDLVDMDPECTVALMCGPELMMLNGIVHLGSMGLPDDSIYVSIERNMQCALGHCGHCQLGPYFVCRDGPVFNYSEIKPWFGKAGI